MTETRQTFAAAVRAARKRKGLTQLKLAELTGMSLDAVGSLERGITAPTIDTAGKLIRVLEIDANKVFAVAPGRRAAGSRRLDVEAELQRVAEELTDQGADLLLQLAKAVVSVHGAPRPVGDESKSY